MQIFDPKNPNEKKKMIAAGLLALVALLVLGYIFFGGSSKPPANRVANTPTATPRVARDTPPPESLDQDPSTFQPIVYTNNHPAVSEADRNIFSYYEPPPPPVKQLPPPSPIPTPPLTISSLAPSTVYARTADFSLQVMGDKFAAGINIIVDGRIMATRFISPRQLATTVTSDLIANPGTRQILVKNADGSLYSSPVTLNVTPPPVPNYNYIGLIGKPRFNDTAVLQDKNTKDLKNIERGDLVGGRFRVSSISDKEVVLIDTELKIKHTIKFSADASQQRPGSRRITTDDDP
jgi:hypothetical protein